ncbi:MAG: hypothetical protein IT395_06180 [Candidatus Omnitrophica bacterium]|nr:hypothetical protein [Candidatus Omnitrophota bacterium]
MKKTFKQIIAVFLALLLPFQGLGIAPALAQTPSLVTLSPAFAPAVLRGLQVDPQNPFHFNFVLDNGHSQLTGETLKSEGTKLIKYFLASLTLPENDLWVNLSPYEKDRIITNEFGQTEMGRELLSEDYLLKKLSASLLHPDSESGNKFWKKVHQVVGTDIPVDTFNRIWIMPDKAVVYQDQGTAFIGETHLKVLLEEDYKSTVIANPAGVKRSPLQQIASSPPQGAPRNDIPTQVFREHILPIIEKEVNEGENFASLRQIYHSLILASWYKRTLKQSLLSQVYVDQKKVAGVESDDKDAKQKIYEQYLETFKRGVYNLIREEQDAATGEVIPRKYFSGGVTLLVSSSAIETRPLFEASALTTGKLSILDTSAQGFTTDAVASIDVKQGIYKTELTDWLGSDLVQRFEQLNRSNRLPLVKIKLAGQNTQEHVVALKNALDQFSDPEEWVAVVLQGDIKRRPDEASPWFFNLYVDQVKNLSAPTLNQGMVTPGGLSLNVFELGLSFRFYPTTRTLYFDKISFGKSEDVRGQGLMRETLSKIALNFANYFEGQYILSMISSDATRKWFNKNFSLVDRSRPGYYSFIEDIFFDLRINPGEMASPRLMIGVIPGEEFVTNPSVAASSAVNSFEVPLKSSVGEITVEFNNVIDSFTNEDQDDRAVARLEIEYLQPIIGKLVEHEIIVGTGVATEKSISVENLTVTNGHRIFLVGWGSQRYVVKRAKGELYNKFIKNDWEILNKLNSDLSKRRPDIARPVLYGEEPLTRVAGDSRPLTAYLVTEYLDGEDLSEAIKPQRGPLTLSEVVNLGIS